MYKYTIIVKQKVEGFQEKLVIFKMFTKCFHLIVTYPKSFSIKPYI